MTETTAQPLTRDDVRAIVSEEIGKVGHLLGQSALNSNEPSLEIAEGDDKVRKDQAHKVVAGVLTDQFDEPLPQPYNRGGLLGYRPLADGFGDICDKVGVTHNSSPSVDDAGAHSVGDGPGARDASATPATEVTDPHISARYDAPLNAIAMSVGGTDDLYFDRDATFLLVDELRAALHDQAKNGGLG
ncbi:MAG: hypothetical protein U5O16_02920 [Rhodococcus sp. (in: high G+C Gram-positive bacteria)]|uniref:hypothetical protein n=1 Tax=Rhodococcus sp. TaxID=1831 RepID=UPI002ADCCD2D|nr:hypothetical protein [Rhodococcus sp. (in: high G+C Gram-positive bacteria)]